MPPSHVLRSNRDSKIEPGPTVWLPDSVLTAEGLLNLMQERLRLVPLARQLLRSRLALRFQCVQEGSICETVFASRLVAFPCALILGVFPKLVAERQCLLPGRGWTALSFSEYSRVRDGQRRSA